MQYLPDPEENRIASRFESWLCEMESDAKPLLSRAQLRAFETYDFPGHRWTQMLRPKWQRYFRGLIRGEQWLIRHVLDNKPHTFVDLGCGLGTWCFLAAIAGMRKTVGIDLNKGQLEVGELFAQKRFARHSSAEVKFLRANLFNVEYERPVDVFYLKASIHHILPIPDLFEYLYRHLAPGGIVVVHDVNALHPLSQYNVLRTRGLRTREMHRDPETGETWEYAVEDIFTLPGILWRFHKHGFRLIYKQAYLGLRSRASDPLWRYGIEPLNRSMLLGSIFARAYRLVAQKPLS